MGAAGRREEPVCDPAAARAWSLCLLLERPKSVRGGAGGRGAASPLPRLPFFFFFFLIFVKKKFLNKLSEGSCQWGGRAGPDRPPSRPQAGPRSSPGVCWWPRGALQGGRGVRPHRDVLAGACGEKADGGSAGSAGWSPPPLDTTQSPWPGRHSPA